MKTNKMLPDSSISKVWENFRKMNGIVIEFLANNWVSQSNNTFTNTVKYEGFTSKEILEIDLYDDGNLTETQISEYDRYITEFNVEDGKIVAISTTKPTQTIKILARGEIVGEKVIVNGGGSSDISASNVSCLDKDGNKSTVQTEIDKQNKKIYPSDVILEFGKVTTSGEARTITLQKEYTEMIYFNIGAMPAANSLLPRQVIFTAPNKVSFQLYGSATASGIITPSLNHGYIFVGK